MSAINLSVDVLNILYLMYLEFYSNTLLGEKITRPGESSYPAKREETNKKLLIELTVALAVTDATLSKLTVRMQVKNKSQFHKKLQNMMSSEFFSLKPDGTEATDADQSYQQ